MIFSTLFSVKKSTLFYCHLHITWYTSTKKCSVHRTVLSCMWGKASFIVYTAQVHKLENESYTSTHVNTVEE